MPPTAAALGQATTFRLYALLLIALLATPFGPAQADPRGDGLQTALRALARPLTAVEDLDPLLQGIADARLVLLGEASHGTHEFYVWRDRLSRRLIRERGFSFIAIEGDWTSLLALDRYVRHHPEAPASAHEALMQVERWPRWVWANQELVALGEWLRAFNRDRPAPRRVGIHGIDLYAVWESLDAVQAFYDRYLPRRADRVRLHYRWLRSFGGDHQGYAAAVRGTRRSARAEILPVADDLARRYQAAQGGDREWLFDALQHAAVVVSGEHYLSNMTRPGAAASNTRAAHFERSLGRLLDHYGPASRAIVWAHNTHIGDARATESGLRGEVSLGQLLRERQGQDAVYAVGFATGRGSVLAAPVWGGPRETMPMPVPRPDSLEAALLAAADGDRLLLFEPGVAASAVLRRALPHRAVGVVFDPDEEARENYVRSRPALRYDALVFVPRSRALTPLDPG